MNGTQIAQTAGVAIVVFTAMGWLIMLSVKYSIRRERRETAKRRAADAAAARVEQIVP